MGRLSELYNTQDIVKEILEEHPEARDSDGILMSITYQVIGKKKGIDISSMSVPAFFLRMSELRLPSTETVRRTRQRLQAEYPRLCGKDTVLHFRKENEEAYEKYAIGIRTP